ncbi:hypothetical protein GGF46_004166 [Coemansia sp. RSA 552]|nr:hypothetical protein GGF46_004166 [Coemansia sp. RSA 552]
MDAGAPEAGALHGKQATVETGHDDATASAGKQDTEHSTEQSTEQTTDGSTEKSTEQNADRNTETVGKSAEETVVKSAEETAERSTTQDATETDATETAATGEVASRKDSGAQEDQDSEVHKGQDAGDDSGPEPATAEPAAEVAAPSEAILETRPGVKGGAKNSGDSHADQPSVESVTDALQEADIVDVSQTTSAVVGAVTSPSEADRISQSMLSPPGISRTSSKSPATSHPLQGDGSGLSPAEVASAILLKDGDAARPYGAGSMPQSAGSEITAFSPPPRALSTPRLSGSPRNMRAEVAEISEEDEDSEDRQRRLLRAAERRRLDRERMSQSNASSVDIEAVRSGLSNATESPSPTRMQILNGAFPEGLRGSLYLLGPGQLDIKYNVQRELEQATRVFTFGNVMDALPLLTKVTFDPGERAIVHRSRLIAKQAASRIQMEHGVTTKVPGALYMSDTNQTALSRFIPKGLHYATPEGECCGQDIQLFMPLQGASETVVCTNHVGALQNIDMGDLRPKATVDLRSVNRAFKGDLSCPHMQYDASTREHFTVVQEVGFRSATYRVVCISASQPDGYVVASFTAQASVLHSFAITQDYIVVPVYPYNVPIGGTAYRWSDSLLETLTFDPSQPTLFYVISREYRRVQCVYQTRAFFAMHQINAAQETATDSVFIDMETYDDDSVLRRLSVKSLRKPSSGFPVPAGVVRRFQLAGVAMEATRFTGSRGAPSQIPQAQTLILRKELVELGRVNPNVAARPYTYLYALGHAEGLQGGPIQPAASGAMYNSIVKLNINDSAVAPVVWSRTHCYPSEPVFVPRSSSKEDDGYILSVFFDSMRIASCLLVLDAATFEEVLIAQLPTAVPVSFGHSKFSI